MKRARLLLLSGLFALAGSCTEPGRETAPLRETLRVSSGEACDMLIEAINSTAGFRESHFYPEARIAGCEGGESEDIPGLIVLRLNAVCRQELCGSVLMGWYAVDVETMRVWEWDVEAWQLGEEITDPILP